MNTYKSDFRSAYNLLKKYKDDPYEDPVKTEEMLAELANYESKFERDLKISVLNQIDRIYYAKHKEEVSFGNKGLFIADTNFK